MDNDFLLINKMKSGKEDAFDTFVNKYYDDIMKYCHYHCHDFIQAEDLTQETFIRFFEQLSSYQHIGKVKNLLYVIAGNLCKDFLRKRQDIPLKNIPESGKNRTDNILNRIAVEEALEKIPEELREVVVLYYFQRMKLVEISDILGIGLPLTKYRVKRAKDMLKKLLDD